MEFAHALPLASAASVSDITRRFTTLLCALLGADFYVALCFAVGISYCCQLYFLLHQSLYFVLRHIAASDCNIKKKKKSRRTSERLAEGDARVCPRAPAPTST